MSKRNSTQPITLTQKLLGKWATHCVNRPHAILAVCVLFSLVGMIAAWGLWFPYSSPVSQLPKNFQERLAWEETSRQTQFNSEIMIRVSIAETGLHSGIPEDNISSAQSRITEQHLNAAVDFLKHRLSGSKKNFCDVISSRDLQITQTRELYELPDDDLQLLVAELHDARQVLDDKWALLESTNYVNWLTARLQPVQTEISKIASPQGTGQPSPASQTAMPQPNTQVILAENRRLLEATTLFAVGLRQTLSQPFPPQNRELITPWQLNPDALFAKVDARVGSSINDGKPSQENTTVMIWVKLTEPQLANMMDRRVIAKTKKIDRQLVAKLNTSMSELFRIVDDAREQFDDLSIEPFGVPVDVYHSQTSSFTSRTAGLLGLFVLLAVFFIAGFGHLRLCLVILVAVLCSFGIYLGFCSPWFEKITPFILFIGITVPLFGVCAGIMQAVTYLNTRRKGLGVSEAVVEMMQTSGKSILCGGLVSFIVFFGSMFYLWHYPVEPTTATLSFRSSLVGVNLMLFLLAQSVLACLVGQIAIVPSLLPIMESDRRTLTSPWQSMIDTRDVVTPIKTLPAIPLPLTVLLTFLLFGGFLYFVSRSNTTTGREEKYYVTSSEMQASVMPILVSRQSFVQSDFGDIHGLFACDATRRVARHDEHRNATITQMSRNAGQTSTQQKIPLPDQQALHYALGELHRRLGYHFSDLQKIAATDNKKSVSLQEDLHLCQTAWANISEACRLLTLLPQKDYYERVDAWQQAIAGDLVLQQRSLQNRLYHEIRPETEIPSAIAKRFLDADQRPLVWLFPNKNWQTVASREQPLPVIDLLIAQENEYHAQPPGLSAPTRGGFPLLVLEGRQLMREQLPVVAAVTLIILLLSIVVVHQSVAMGAMAMLTIIGGVSLYGMLLVILGIPFGKISLFPVVFFPLVLPVFLEMFRHPNLSPDQFKASLGGTLISLGVGIVVAGHLMFYTDLAVITAGRTMTMGWAALMLSLIVNLISTLLPETVRQAPPAADPGIAMMQWHNTKTQTGIEWKPIQDRQLDAAEPEPEPEQNPVAKPQSDSKPPDHVTRKPWKPEQPARLATREQLDFYRERIEATRVFTHQASDIKLQAASEESVVHHHRSPKSEARSLPTSKESIEHHPAPPKSEVRSLPTSEERIEHQPQRPKAEAQNILPVVAGQPKFPSVWNIGTKRHTTQNIVVELADDVLLKWGEKDETVVSLATPVARVVARKSPRTMLVARQPQLTQDNSSPDDIESPTILSMRSSDNNTERPPKTSRRKLG